MSVRHMQQKVSETDVVSHTSDNASIDTQMYIKNMFISTKNLTISYCYR